MAQNGQNGQKRQNKVSEKHKSITKNDKIGPKFVK